MNYSLEVLAHNTTRRLAALPVLALCLISATAENQPAPKKASSGPAPASQEITIPKSIFLVPTKPEDGTDPFFPKVARLKAVAPSPTPRSYTADLVLKGFSGTAQHRFAIINNHTFASGEEGDLIATAGGRIHLRCLEVKADSVIIEIEGVQRELRLRPGL